MTSCRERVKKKENVCQRTDLLTNDPRQKNSRGQVEEADGCVKKETPGAELVGSKLKKRDEPAGGAKNRVP